MRKPSKSENAGARLVFFLILVFSWHVTAVAQSAAEAVVNSFESTEEMARLKPLGDAAVVAQSTEHATDGKHSLCVTFRSAAAKHSGLRMNLRRADGSPADWSTFRSLRLDVYNPFHADRPKGHQRSAARIDFSIKDAKGNTWWHRCALSEWASAQVLDAPLVTTMNKMCATGDDPFDFRSVVEVSIYTKRPDEDLVLVFDNMKLLPKAEGGAAKAPADRPAAERAAPRSVGRDFTFAQFYHGRDYPYEEKGFFRLGRGPVVLRLCQPGYSPAPAAELPELKGQIAELRRREIPFHVIVFNFWGGRYETYDEATTRLREAIAAFQAEGGDCFQAVWLHELEAITYYRIVGEQTGRLNKANAYVQFLRRFIRDIDVPPGKFVIVNRGVFLNYGLDYEAGVDAVLPETLFWLDNIELCMAQARGMARSFGRWWGGDTARYSEGPSTARYNRDGSATPVAIDFSWWKIADVYKAFIQHYYSGAEILRGQSEWPARRPEDGPMFDRFLRFVGEHPRAGRAMAGIAVVRGKGDYWAGANLHGSSQGLADWVKAEGTRKEELDFLYLNTFFPGFSTDGHTAERYWTGTPYGPIDVIYPAIPLQAMKEYDVVIFMGFHRMDSVRADFLADLTRYVEEGGTILIAADALRMSDEKLAPLDAMKKLIGAEVSEKTRPIVGPIRVVDQEAVRFSKDRYDLPADAKPVVHEATPTTAVMMAKDANGLPLLMRNSLGKGCVFFLTTPTFSTMPPGGGNTFIRGLVAVVAGRARQPVTISPPSEHVEFVLSKAKEGRAVVFLMNHERAEWTGKIVVDPDRAGLSVHGAPEASMVICREYESRECKVNVSLDGNRIIVDNVKLPGGSDAFDPFRAASFGIVTIRGGKE